MPSDIQLTAKKYGFEEHLSKSEDGEYYYEEYVGQTLSYGLIDEKFVFRWKDEKCILECQKSEKIHVFDSFEDAITQIWESPKYAFFDMPFLNSFMAAYDNKYVVETIPFFWLFEENEY